MCVVYATWSGCWTEYYLPCVPTTALLGCGSKKSVAINFHQRPTSLLPEREKDTTIVVLVLPSTLLSFSLSLVLPRVPSSQVDLSSFWKWSDSRECQNWRAKGKEESKEYENRSKHTFRHLKWILVICSLSVKIKILHVDYVCSLVWSAY